VYSRVRDQAALPSRTESASASPSPFFASAGDSGGGRIIAQSGCRSGRKCTRRTSRTSSCRKASRSDSRRDWLFRVETRRARDHSRFTDDYLLQCVFLQRLVKCAAIWRKWRNVARDTFDGSLLSRTSALMDLLYGKEKSRKNGTMNRAAPANS